MKLPVLPYWRTAWRGEGKGLTNMGCIFDHSDVIRSFISNIINDQCAWRTERIERQTADEQPDWLTWAQEGCDAFIWMKQAAIHFLLHGLFLHRNQVLINPAAVVLHDAHYIYYYYYYHHYNYLLSYLRSNPELVSNILLLLCICVSDKNYHF